MANTLAEDRNLTVKLAVYNHFAETAARPSPGEIAERTGFEAATVLATYRDLQAQRVLVLEEDGRSIRMAPPFSGTPTQHTAQIDGRRYFANCAWDVLGIPAALHRPAVVHSRCEQSGEKLRMAVAPEGPPASDWLFHSTVPAAHWWDDIVFT